MKTTHGLLLALAAACVVSLGCYPVRSVEVAGGDPPPSKREPGVVKKGGGPPDHAPAHGRRAKYRYRYYPDVSVYFDAGRGLYFYLFSGSWKFSTRLPGDLSGRLGSSVFIEMDSDKPYIEHDRHKAKYPPGQAKKGHDDDERGKGKKKERDRKKYDYDD